MGKIHVPATKDAKDAGPDPCQACPAGKTSPAGSDNSANCSDIPAAAPADAPFAVSFTVTMPYSVQAFDKDKQTKYKEAVASAAGVNEADVVIVSVVDVTAQALRRAGGASGGTRLNGAVWRIEVQTDIRAVDVAAADRISLSLGSGDTLKTKLTESFQAAGLKAPTSVSDPVKQERDATGELDLTFIVIIVASVGAGGVLLCCGIVFACMRIWKKTTVHPTRTDIVQTAEPTAPTVIVQDVSRGNDAEAAGESVRHARDAEESFVPTAELSVPPVMVQETIPTGIALAKEGVEQPLGAPKVPRTLFCEGCGNRVQVGLTCDKCGEKCEDDMDEV